MHRALTNVELWGPLVISLVTLFALIGHAWSEGERTAKLEGRVVGCEGVDAEAAKLGVKVEQLERNDVEHKDAFELQGVYNDTYDRKIIELQLQVNPGKGK